MSGRRKLPAQRKSGGPKGDPPEFRFFNEVGIIEQLARNRFERVMPKGMSMAQFSVLNHFVRLGGSKQQVDLARAFQVSKPAMTRTVRKLRDKGYVRVEPDPLDGRGKLVSITAAGRAARDDAIDRLAPVLAEFRGAVDGKDIGRVIPVLESARIWLDENR